MHPLKRWLLNAQVGATYPARMRRRARLRAERRCPWAVLYYHRVADDHLTPWTITSAAFERQMRWLRRRFDLISLAEGQARLRAGANDRIAVSITFDDGYADNCRRALPLLIELEIPCTYFVTSHNILAQRPFPHDLKLGRPLAPNTAEQIRALAEAGIDVGAHTRTHADLGRVVDEAVLHDELVIAQMELEQIAGKPVRYFAFPYGQKVNLSRRAFDVARQVYDGACSAYGGYNFPGDDLFHLERIAVDDELVRLKNWLTLDARKLRASARDRAWAQNLFVVSETSAATEPAEVPA